MNFLPVNMNAIMLMDNWLFNQEVECVSHWTGQSELIILIIHPKL
jgi:hypothetical protein